MDGTLGFVGALALVVCAAAVAAVGCRRLNQPVVVGYLLAGVVIGPHVPPRLLSDSATLHGLAELGVILVMFSLGLEFTFSRLARVLPRSGPAALIEVSLTLWVGCLAAGWLGFSATESLFAGSMVAISSTTVVSRALTAEDRQESFTDVAFGVLLVEDLVAVVMLAAIATLSGGLEVNLRVIGITLGRLAAFLAVLVAAGMFVIPRLIAMVARLNHEETLLLASLGICFGLAIFARALGYSVALGAFAAGTLISESGERARVEGLVATVRDVFAAIFFVAVGMLIDPAALAQSWYVVALFVVVVLGCKFAGVTVGTFLAGAGPRASVRAGMTLGQIGEFSFIIAAAGVARGIIPTSLYSVVVAVSFVTTLLTPWMIRLSPRVAATIDRRLPKPVQTFAAFYDTWLARLLNGPEEGGRWSEAGWCLRWVVVDTLILAAIVIGISVESPVLRRKLGSMIEISPTAARIAIAGVALVLAAPFLLGVANMARRLSQILAAEALPRPKGRRLDLADAPRRALVAVIQLAIILLIGVPLLALTQPFLPPFGGVPVMAAVVGVMGIAFWRSAAGFQGHAKAGAQMIVEVLARQRRRSREMSLGAVQKMLPGFGVLTPVRLGPRSKAAGMTLANLNLRANTGATVLAIVRTGGNVAFPSAREVLRAGDLLALAGTEESIRAAQALLSDGPAVMADL